jgi:hypothetical protein
MCVCRAPTAPQLQPTDRPTDNEHIIRSVRDEYVRPIHEQQIRECLMRRVRVHVSQLVRVVHACTCMHVTVVLLSPASGVSTRPLANFARHNFPTTLLRYTNYTRTLNGYRGVFECWQLYSTSVCTKHSTTVHFGRASVHSCCSQICFTHAHFSLVLHACVSPPLKHTY